MMDDRKFVEWVLGAGVQHSSLHPGRSWDLVDRGQGSTGDADLGALQFAHTCLPRAVGRISQMTSGSCSACQACSRGSKE